VADTTCFSNVESHLVAPDCLMFSGLMLPARNWNSTLLKQVVSSCPLSTGY